MKQGVLSLENPYLPYPVRIDKIITETEDKNLKTFQFVFLNTEDEEKFSYIDAFSKVTCNPAEIIKVDRGELKENGFADIVIVDQDKEVEITEEFIHSNCKNSPFIGMKLKGSVECSICNGEIVFENK